MDQGNANDNPPCSNFATQPEGTRWDPYDVRVDAAKQLVYVADRDYSAIHVFDYDGFYFGRLEKQARFLSNPSSLAVKPGALAALSPISPPTTATAGVEIITPLALHDATNSPLSPSYPITEELHRFLVVARGEREGSATTLHGSLVDAKTAAVVINFAGVWTVEITEGISNPQHLVGSPYEITVQVSRRMAIYIYIFIYITAVPLFPHMCVPQPVFKTRFARAARLDRSVHHRNDVHQNRDRWLLVHRRLRSFRRVREPH